MSDDQPSSEILKQLCERLDLLERVLGTNTARLHSIEKHLEIVRQLDEPLASESGDTRSATSDVKTEDLNCSEASQPTAVEPPAVGPQPREFPDGKWSQSEARLPSATEVAGTPAMPATPPTHSWLNEPSAPPSYETREAATPFPLHHPLHHLQAERTAAAAGQTPLGPGSDS